MSTKRVTEVDPAVLERMQKATKPEKPETVLAADQVELEINGKSVVMGAPLGGTIRQIAVLLDDAKGNLSMLIVWLKALMYVRSIDGVPTTAITSIIDAQKLANALGANGEDIVMQAYQELWPPVTKESLPIVKKS